MKLLLGTAMIALILFDASVAFAWQTTTELDELPTIRETEFLLPARDFLIDPGPFLAKVGRSDDGRSVVLDNGLVRRTWRVAPNGACVGFDNLMTGQSMLRSVRPEARVTIDGERINVGGLVGQPNHAFLTPDWLNAMSADSRSMQLVGIETGEPAERFAWGKRRHAASDSIWPPKGVYLRMDYEMPAADSSESLASDFARQSIWQDNFATISKDWLVKVSDTHPRTSVENEGKPGEIYAPTGAHCFVEREIPSDTSLIEAVLNPGSDTDTSWGPGIAWVFEKETVKLNLRPGDRGVHGQFELRVNGKEQLASAQPFESKDRGLDPALTYGLRIRTEGDQLVMEAAVINERTPVYYPLFQVRREGAWGSPVAMRVGKMDRRGGASDDGGEKSNMVRLRIDHAAAYGPLDGQAMQRANETAGNITVQSSVRVSVHYELYDGVPAMSKWITVYNQSEKLIVINRFTSEELAVVEQASWVEARNAVQLPKPDYLHVETDFAFGGMTPLNANRYAVHWRADPLFTSQVNYSKRTPCLLLCEPTLGPEQKLAPGKVFEGFRVFELVYDSTDRERRGLAYRRMYRTIAPWVTENPITHHLLTNDPQKTRVAIDQAAEVGFEAIILSFGSGFNMENREPEFLSLWKGVADYAEEKGIELGSYSLLSSRGVEKENMTVSPEGTRPTHGRIPSLASEWGQNWLDTIREFYQKTGFDQFENDGPYPGDVDVTSRPPIQFGINDSRWVGWQQNRALYRSLCEEGIYINQPDYKFLNGGNKTSMGYREVNWSLPREQQVIHTRQNIYDGTWLKTPSMGWMHVPLSQYQGGGAAATVEPLHEHLDHYERMMLSNLGLGVQAHYRGPRIYDLPQTRDMVKSKVDWFKRYRDILESDLVHGRRADGQQLDWMLHVNPQLDINGMLCVYNPLDKHVTKTIRVNLYYTGLTDVAVISASDQAPVDYELARDYTVDVEVTVPPLGMSWYVIRKPSSKLDMPMASPRRCFQDKTTKIPPTLN